ncbi:MAG TPA: hypothetical protein V6D02_14815, partial [Candidatus Obscuribacterales bacterium]
MSNQGAAEADGLTLQRGGEELLLTKVSDRFTTQLAQPGAVAALQTLIQPVAMRPVAQGQLVEWQVAAAQLEALLATVRSHPEVQFASHVYQLVSSPRTWIYLTNQLTVQWAATVLPSEGRAIAQSYGLATGQPLEGIPNTVICRVTPQARENPVK